MGGAASTPAAKASVQPAPAYSAPSGSAPKPAPSRPSLADHAKNVFWGASAAPYLVKAGLKPNELEDPMWVKDTVKPDKVASALLEWALDRGASSFCHWFQPMCGFKRHGQAACVQLAMFDFDNDKKAFWELRGKDLLRGETDGSSFPSGNLRKTHTAAAYLTIDPLSPIFLCDDCIYVPACMVSWNGDALDEKTPLHRAEEALSREGKRMFALLGHTIGGMYTNIGLEQELFFVPDDAYQGRPDLIMCGRTLLGARPAVTQKGDTHYMAPINKDKSVYACMKEIQQECYKIGIPLKTRHREVAPNQYEFAPLFGRVIGQVDNNLMVMQICEETAPKHGLRCLLAEKPFAGVNGSGKHNNWSISTTEGVQLLNPGNLQKGLGGDANVFPIVMACIIAAVDEFGDLMRMSISTPGNDYRLGGMEAPPSIISCYLGQTMTDFLSKWAEGDDTPYNPLGHEINLNVTYLPTVTAPPEDRNRTSPFPYGGHRFEFRAAGSSQNVSMINTVLSSIVAYQFSMLCDKVEGDKDPKACAIAYARELVKKHMRVVFNGNGYDESWPKVASEKGLFVIDSSVKAIQALTAEKNTAMFSKVGVLSPEECRARKYILLEQYINTVQEEVGCLVSMIRRQVIPSVVSCGMGEHVKMLEEAAKTLESDMEEIIRLEEEAESMKIEEIGSSPNLTNKEDEEIMRRPTNKYEDNPAVFTKPRFEVCADLDAAASKARETRLEHMRSLRLKIDEIEEKVPLDKWQLPSYAKLFFIDQTM